MITSPSCSSLESKHLVVCNHVKKCFFYKIFMHFFSRAFEYALVLWTELLTSSICLWLCKVSLQTYVFNFRFLLYTVEVTATQSQKLKSIQHLWKPPIATGTGPRFPLWWQERFLYALCTVCSADFFRLHTNWNSMCQACGSVGFMALLCLCAILCWGGLYCNEEF